MYEKQDGMQQETDLVDVKLEPPLAARAACLGNLLKRGGRPGAERHERPGLRGRGGSSALTGIVRHALHGCS